MEFNEIRKIGQNFELKYFKLQSFSLKQSNYKSCYRNDQNEQTKC